VGQRSNWNRTVIGSHAPKLITSDQRRLRAQVSSTKSGQHAGGTSSNYDDI
jgi:hypothetical protein